MSNINNLGTERVSKLLAVFAIPSIISLIVNALYNIVDQIFIGQYIGELGNAATTVVFPIVIISLAFSLVIGNGGAAYFSIQLGRKNSKRATQIVNTVIVSSLIIGIILVVIILPFYKPLLILFGASDNVLPYAMEYARIILYGFPFVIFSLALNAVIRADGSPRFSMYSMIIGAVINTILDPILIHNFNLGIKGAAIATVIGQIIVFAITFYYTFFKFKNAEVNTNTVIKCLFNFRFRLFYLLLNYGMSSFFTQISISIVQIVINNSLRYYGELSVYGGEIPLAAFGIVMKVTAIITSVIIGIGIGAQPILGYNYGLKKYTRVIYTYRLEIIVSSLISIIGWIVFVFYPEGIIPLFGKSSNPLYYEFLEKSFRIYALFFLLAGFQINTAMFFQSIGEPVKSTILTMSRSILILVPFLLILPLFYGIEGMLYAGPLTDLLSSVLVLYFIVKSLKNLKYKGDE